MFSHVVLCVNQACGDNADASSLNGFSFICFKPCIFWTHRDFKTVADMVRAGLLVGPFHHHWGRGVVVAPQVYNEALMIPFGRASREFLKIKKLTFRLMSH